MTIINNYHQHTKQPVTATAMDSISAEYHFACTRLMAEWKDLEKSSYSGIFACPKGDAGFLCWEGTITGVKGTVSEGTEYKLSLSFPDNYPFKPPKVKFETACFLPNVDVHGNICLDILEDKWSPCYDIRSILLSIQSLLSFQSVLEGNQYPEIDMPVTDTVIASSDTPVTATAIASSDSPVTTTAIASSDLPVTATAIASSDSPVTATAIASYDLPVTATAITSSEQTLPAAETVDNQSPDKRLRSELKTLMDKYDCRSILLCIESLLDEPITNWPPNTQAVSIWGTQEEYWDLVVKLYEPIGTIDPLSRETAYEKMAEKSYEHAPLSLAECCELVEKLRNPTA